MTSDPRPIDLLPGLFAVARLRPEAAVPAWAEPGPFVSITRTPEELSIVCAESAVPPGIPAERGLRGLRVEGPLEFGQVGILAAMATTLAAAGVSLFAVSTYDTDYLFVHQEDLAASLEALSGAGHPVRPEVRP